MKDRVHAEEGKRCWGSDYTERAGVGLAVVRCELREKKW